MRSLIRVSAALALLGMFHVSAHAHAHLKSSTPADNATLVTGPSVITLEFNEGIELKVSKVTVTGPGKDAVKTGDLVHGKGGETVVEVPVQGPLAPGSYTIEWRVLSKDGHKVKGHSSFTLKP